MTQTLPHAENQVKIFVVNTNTATEVSDIDNLTNAPITPVDKELYININDLAQVYEQYGINPDTNMKARVDNFEGMTLNFNTENKSWELILVTDNNSNKKYQGGTQFLTIKLKTE